MIANIIRLAAFALVVGSPPGTSESYRFEQIRCTLSLPSQWQSSSEVLKQLQSQAGDSASYSAVFVRSGVNSSNPPFISVQVHEAANLALEDLAQSLAPAVSGDQSAYLPPGVSMQTPPGGQLRFDKERAALFARSETYFQGELQRVGVLGQFVGRSGALQLNIYFSDEDLLAEGELETILGGVAFDEGHGYSPKSKDLVVLETIGAATRGAAVAMSLFLAAVLCWGLLRRLVAKPER